MSLAALTPAEVRHLLRRCSFAAVAEQVERLQGRPLDAVLDELLHEDASGSFRAADPAMSHREVQQWWLQRMLEGPGIRETLALFLNSYLGCASAPVQPPGALAGRVQTLRLCSLDSFPRLLQRLVLDPATMMQTGIDGHDRERVSDRPAKIVLERWTVGMGGFSGQDLEDLSRAMTGWKVPPRSLPSQVSLPYFDAKRHDAGGKTLFGESGTFDCAAAVLIAARRPQTGERFSRALLEELGVFDPPGALLGDLARVWRDTEGSIPTLLRAAVRSDAFWSPAARWQVIKSPVRVAVGACRQLGLTSAPEGLVDWLVATGQPLFDTPGNGERPWPRGAQWLDPPDRLARRYRLSRLLPLPGTLLSDSAADDWLARLDPAPGLEPGLRRERRRGSADAAGRIAARILDSAQYQLA